VEDRGGNGLVVHTHAGQNRGDGNGVQNVIFARAARLPTVGFFTNFEGVERGCNLLRLKVCVEQPAQFTDGARITHTTGRYA